MPASSSTRVKASAYSVRTAGMPMSAQLVEGSMHSPNVPNTRTNLESLSSRVLLSVIISPLYYFQQSYLSWAGRGGSRVECGRSGS